MIWLIILKQHDLSCLNPMAYKVLQYTVPIYDLLPMISQHQFVLSIVFPLSR